MFTRTKKLLDSPLLELLIAVGGVLSLTPRLFDSLWLDEFAAALGANLPLSQALKFRWMDLFSSAPFYLLVSLSTSLLGFAEHSLRLPSLALLALSGLMIYILMLELLSQYCQAQDVRNSRGKILAASSAAILVNLPLLRDQAVNARPYMLVLFLSLLGLYFVVKRHSSQPIAALLAGTSFALAIYCHPYAALTPILILLASCTKQTARFFARSCIALSIGVTLCIPLCAELDALWQVRKTLSQPSIAPTALIVFGNAWIVLAVVFRSCLKSSRIKGLGSWYLEPLSVPASILLGTLCVGPVIFLLLASYSSQTNLLSFSRYHIISSAGFACLLAIVLFSIQSLALSRCYLICSIVIFQLWPSGIASFSSHHLNEDWRGLALALAAEPKFEGIPIVLHSCWIESTQLERLRSNISRKFLELPLRYYGVRNEVFLLPYDLATAARLEYSQNLLREIGGSNNQFLLTSCAEQALIEEQLPLDRTMWHRAHISNFGRIPLYFFSRLAVNTDNSSAT